MFRGINIVIFVFYILKLQTHICFSSLKKYLNHTTGMLNEFCATSVRFIADTLLVSHMCIILYVNHAQKLLDSSS